MMVLAGSDYWQKEGCVLGSSCRRALLLRTSTTFVYSRTGVEEIEYRKMGFFLLNVRNRNWAKKVETAKWQGRFEI